MRLAALSNERLDPWINWSTLGPPLLRPLAEKSGGVHVSPPPIALANRQEWLKDLHKIRQADTLFWMQGSSRPETPIIAASALRGIVRRSAFVVDAWPGLWKKIGWLATIQRLDPCFVAFREAAVELAKAYPSARIEWLPFGIDAEIFRPYPVEKDIFIYWMGRRHEPLHRAIEAYCASRGLTYHYTKVGGEVREPADLGKLVSRARYFVVTPPDLDNPVRTAGMSPLVMRYMEGLASGTRLIGTLPRSGEYEDLLPLDAILQVRPDGSDLAEKLDAEREDVGIAQAVERACELVRTEHSWARRAEQIIERLEAGTVAFPIARTAG